MKTRRIIAAVAVAAVLSGCFKKVETKTNYVLRPFVQRTASETAVELEGVRAYAFNADTARYEVLNYEDALNGVISLRSNPAERITTPAETAAPYEQEGATGWISMTLKKASQLVVAVDPSNKLYAVRQQAIGENLPNLYMTLTFKPWKESTSYKEGNWIFYNEFYTPPTYQTCYIDPSVQAAEGGETTAISSLKAYAYAVDTLNWKIASYNDAVSGILTSKSSATEQLTNPTYTATKESDTRYKLERVTAQSLMLVVVDRVNNRYAYSQQTINLEGTSPIFPVVFQLWQEGWITVDANGWRLVNPAAAPTTAE